MGRTCMEERGNFSADGSIWRSTRKETFGAPLVKIERRSQERCTMMVPKEDWHDLAMDRGKWHDNVWMYDLNSRVQRKRRIKLTLVETRIEKKSISTFFSLNNS